MAIMNPPKPRECTPESREAIMFDALAKLPDDYYVFHSFKVVRLVGDVIEESETDFVVFNRKKGLLCLEAKSGRVKYQDGAWYYGSGIMMKRDGPFRQAQRNMHDLMNAAKDEKKLVPLVSKCKFISGVWFPSIDQYDLDRITLPADSPRRCVLTSEALDNPERFISDLFEIEVPGHIVTRLTESEANLFVNSLLCPAFDLVPALSLSIKNREFIFNRLLHEQATVLRYLEDQPNGVINGAAGTGKTMLAVEKARRHGMNGEKVLFLCYNSKLKNYLAERHACENVKFRTIDGLACFFCNTSEPNYQLFSENLESMYGTGTFPYQHVIIDEGQDFGQEHMEESKVIELLRALILDDESKNGSFYIFYDKNQLVQGKAIPQYISDADTKLTLYRNCRNTENIAKTSSNMLKNKPKIKLAEGCVKGKPAVIYFEKTDEEKNCIEGILEKYQESGYEDIVILTCKREDNSPFSQFCKKDGIDGLRFLYNGKKIPFTTCRKFKGLEADAIVLIDIDEELWDEKKENLLYVGSSRARQALSIICNLSTEQCSDLINRLGIVTSSRNPKKAIASTLCALLN